MNDILENIPDPQSMDYDALVAWVEEKIAIMRQLVDAPEAAENASPYELPSIKEHPCGAEANLVWRKFFLATLLADWACYGSVVDRADYARLKYIMTSAYPYFRLWFCTMPNGEVLPVGYTGWYPIAQFVYEALRDNPNQIDDRGIFMPLRFADRNNIRYAYAFNISIINELRNTSCSRRMIRAYVKDERSLKGTAIAAITVGKDGVKFSNLAGFRESGAVEVQGESETLFLKDAEA